MALGGSACSVVTAWPFRELTRANVASLSVHSTAVAFASKSVRNACQLVDPSYPGAYLGMAVLGDSDGQGWNSEGWEARTDWKPEGPPRSTLKLVGPNAGVASCSDSGITSPNLENMLSRGLPKRGVWV